jgi:DNA-binding Lrp family transcriptional regulator
MHSSLQCLYSIVPNLKADEKLFFILMLSISESSMSLGNLALVRESGVQLGKRFGFTKEASFRALKKLREQGYVDEIMEQGLLGRPRKLRKVVAGSWRSNESNQDLFRARLVTQSFNMINNRLRHPKLAEQAGVSNSLFMLLLILLAKADYSGVVATTSQSKLSQYTGIPRPQMQRRIYQLQELGLITEIIPGLVEGAVLGKPTSIYYLDLNHPVLRDTGIQAEPISIKGKGCTLTEIDELAMKLGHPGLNDRLSSAAQHAATPPGIKKTRISPGSWEQNAPDLLRRPAAKLYTQSVIERYAAKLLSDPNLILSESKWRSAQDHATGDFVQELTGERPTAAKKSGEYSRMFYSLCADLEELSHQLASLCIRVGKLPKRASTVSTPITTYRILPSGTGKRSKIRLERITLRT